MEVQTDRQKERAMYNNLTILQSRVDPKVGEHSTNRTESDAKMLYPFVFLSSTHLSVAGILKMLPLIT